MSRHRQWRAWQFGMRHSGMWKNSNGGSSSSGGDLPWWFCAILAVLMILGCTVWPELLGVLFLLGIIGWIVYLFLL